MTVRPDFPQAAVDPVAITGLVLAGGSGSRMGGVDKGLQPLAGVPLVAHALRRLAPQVGPLLISANRNGERYEGFGHPVVADAVAGRAGPLAGLHAGLVRCKTDFMATVPCDAPFFPLDLVARLSEAFADPRCDLAVACVAGRLQPVFSLMRRSVVDDLATYLAGGGRKVRDWIEHIGGRAVSFDDEPAFRNLNTVEELLDAGMTRAEPSAALPLDEARRLLAGTVEPIVDVERVALQDALGRVLAEDLTSPVRVPAHDNAAMDGYALRGIGGDDEVAIPAPLGFRIVGQARAGHPYAGPVGRDECVRILTGAVMPSDCDTVVPQEEASRDGDRIRLGHAWHAGQHRRLAGEDLDLGATVIAKSRRVTPSDLGLAASVGATTLAVVRRARIAVFSTGDELSDVGQPLPTGSIRDSNRYTLIGLLTLLGVEVVDLGIVRDDPIALETCLLHACDDGVRADAIVTSGGVSAGDADHTRDVLARVGHVAFWKLAVKPGRPMAFGRVARGDRSALLFGLPGNPVATMVIFHALVRDALLRLMGARIEALPSITAISDSAMPKAPGRTDFVRAVASRHADGWHVRDTGAQGSGILRSMSDANCLVVLEHGRGPVAIGDTVEAWPMHGLL